MRLRSFLALSRLELVRVFATRRWLLALAVWGIIAKFASDDILRAVSSSEGGTWTALDVHAASLNSMFYVGFLLLTTFVFVTCDSVVRDRQSRYAALVIPRAELRSSWWISKVVALVAAALAFQLGFLLTCFCFGLASGASPTSVPSDVARFSLVQSAETELAQPLFAPVADGADMAAREAIRVLYLALAFSAIATLTTAISIRVSFAWIPAGLSLALVFADWAANRLIPGDWYQLMSPTLRLLEGIHSPTLVSTPASWLSSVLWWTTVGAVGLVLGRKLALKAEL